jgi:patatin-like phospholipase/acyl hydrolase
MTKADHLSNKTSPKRILALDGGGIRGALTLGYLQRIEDILRKQHGDEKSFRLSQYFDLIGGTSTGSIIAACLAIGMSVNEIKTMNMNLG